ncbi:MAG: cytochrome c oxidase subunit 3 [Nitrososphaeraceae archaeon]
MPPPETQIHLVNHTGLPSYMNVYLLLSSLTAVISHHGLIIEIEKFAYYFCFILLLLLLCLAFYNMLSILQEVFVFQIVQWIFIIYVNRISCVHVIIGNVFLMVSFVRMYFEHFSSDNHKDSF